MASPRSIAARDLILAVVALALGVGIAWMDNSPGWDAVGITVGLLVLAAAMIGAIDGHRPWLWALLVGAPLPIIEVPATGSTAPLVGLLFAAIGAGLGVLVRRALSSAPHAA